MQLKLIAILLLLIPFTDGFSQKGTIEGLITDADSGTPLNGASINLPGNKGDNADLFGQFSIPAVLPGQYEIIVSHVGYETTLVPVEVRADLFSRIRVTMKKAGLDLHEVRINSKRSNGLSAINAIDIRLRPVNNSQDILRVVPGLFIAQHAGGGKAEQLFLRGFDLDHGTDIAITADGIPVNMVSHAHGQGYADLHFLIPETIGKTNFDKGPYFAGKGNLATAAYVDFTTKEFLDRNTLKLEAGRFNTRRIMGMLKLLNESTDNKRRQLYLATEYSTTAGYFKSPQDFHRFNGMAKYTALLGQQSQLMIIASAFDSKWSASGQVPDRAVRTGMISRFGSIDDTEGGMTSRYNLTVKFSKQRKNNWKTTDQFYFSRYGFRLYSNFTFFLEDSVNGDRIRQKENRDIFGYTTTAAKSWLAGNKKASTELGAGFRHDNVKDIELAKAGRSTFFSSLQRGDIKETNLFFYLNQEWELTDKLTVNGGLRYDQFLFTYRDQLAGTGHFAGRSKGTFSPKINFSYSPGPNIKIYVQNGIGFHSNDTRVILNDEARTTLPKVFGTDVGVILKPGKALVLKAALWQLHSQQEFVYVGDAGITEPGGQTRRWGTDISARYQFNKWLFGDLDLNLTRARAVGKTKGENYVPLAPAFTSIGGMTIIGKKGFSGSLRYRFIDNRPANERNSIQAEGYFLLDMVLGYRLGKFDLSLSAENLLNSEWREAQFETESRLRMETAPVSEIHYTPGSPRFVKAGISFSF